ncbi:MAG: hypothetical protein JSW51_03820, partial [Gemmatimonadota bacterium]
IHFSHFDGAISDGKADYRYAIKPGVSDQRFGLQLLEQEDVPRLLEELGNVTMSRTKSVGEES